MTVSTTTNRIDYIGDNAVTVYPYNFLVYLDSHLQVYLDGVLTVSGFAINNDPENSNGDITFDVPPANGVAIAVLRVVPLTQLIDYAAFDPFPAETHERGLDLGVMRDQQGTESDDRALRVPVKDLPVNDIPDKATRAGRTLGFDAEGQPIAGTLIDSTVVGLDDLIDVDLNAPVTTDALIYNAGTGMFENKLPILDIGDLQNVNAAGADDNQILKFISGVWVNSELPASLVFVGDFDPVLNVPVLDNTPTPVGTVAGETYVATDSGLYNFTTGLPGTGVQVSVNDQVVWSEKQLSWVVLATGANLAAEILYDPSSSGLAAGNVQDAIDEVDADLDVAEASIITNAADIATNVTDIATNAAAIAALEPLERNLLSNSTMEIYQRGELAVPPVTGNVVDRFGQFQTSSNATVISTQETTGGPNPARKWLKMEVTVADPTPSAAIASYLRSLIEGAWLNGEANEEIGTGSGVLQIRGKVLIHTEPGSAVTFPFQFNGTVYNEDADETCGWEDLSSVTSPDVWHEFTASVPIGNTPFGNTKARTMRFHVAQYSGGNRTQLAGNWVAGFWYGSRPAAIANLLDQVGNYMGLTDLSIIASDVPSRPLQRGVNEELALCQRYYYIGGNNQNWGSTNVGGGTNSHLSAAAFPHPVEMMVGPTMTLLPAGNVFELRQPASVGDVQPAGDISSVDTSVAGAFGSALADERGVSRLSLTGAIGHVLGAAYNTRGKGFIEFSAEP